MHPPFLDPFGPSRTPCAFVMYDVCKCKHDSFSYSESRIRPPTYVPRPQHEHRPIFQSSKAMHFRYTSRWPPLVLQPAAAAAVAVGWKMATTTNANQTIYCVFRSFLLGQSNETVLLPQSSLYIKPNNSSFRAYSLFSSPWCPLKHLWFIKLSVGLKSLLDIIVSYLYHQTGTTRWLWRRVPLMMATADLVLGKLRRAFVHHGSNIADLLTFGDFGGEHLETLNVLLRRQSSG